MDCFGTYFTHAQSCDNVRVPSATEWTASVHTLHMPKAVITFPKASKGYLRNVRCIKGGLLRKDGCLANADIGPKKQHFH